MFEIIISISSKMPHLYLNKVDIFFVCVFCFLHLETVLIEVWYIFITQVIDLIA